MSTVILLSSSPPRTFARSPTPANSSSPLPSTIALLHGGSPGRKKFKTQVAERDGFPAAFSTARQVLAEKSGAENKNIASPARYRFRSSQDDCSEEVVKKQNARKSARANSALEIDTSGPKPDLPAHVKSKQALTTKKPNAGLQQDDRQKEKLPEPLLVQRAVARKVDWTPPKPQVRRDSDEKPTEYSAGFMNGMLSSFSYADVTATNQAPRISEAGNPTKRRRLGSPSKARLGGDVLSVPNAVKTGSVPGKPVPRRNRSPSKKTLTITGVATSNYLGAEESNATPLMQYLTSTQAQLHDTVVEAGLETKVRKSQNAIKRLKRVKKNEPKSLLLSPTSAMKTYESQETIFGSASQLTRDESPTLIRETIEATKESESFMLSDPICSPQRTQLASVENTPKTGTSRFRRTRNLWAAAGRDEDNALLHVDTIDLSDSPAVRAAFAGKDVLLQPNARPPVPLGKRAMSLRGGNSPLGPHDKATVFDIADLTTLCGTSTRLFSTTARQATPRESPVRPFLEQAEAASGEDTTSIKPKDPPPLKPNYAGFSTQDLNKQIKSFGFKAMRKREKMIELLDRCWEEKHGSAEDAVEQVPEPVAPFGDFLSKVHDLSARPEPKAKKPRVRKKKEELGEPSDMPVKKSRQRKKAESTANLAGDGQEKPKVARKRKSKVQSTGKGSIIDIDSFLESIPEELRALEAFDDWAKPERPSRTKAKTEAASTIVEAQVPPKPSTPVISVTTLSAPPLSEEVVQENEATVLQNESILTPASGTSPPTLCSPIALAILHQSKSSNAARNHHTHPTWHEKILLYDPIILEDLATWLNTEGLGAIGEDREVSAVEVREWCESQGICCLWRGGWRGNKAAQ